VSEHQAPGGPGKKGLLELFNLKSLSGKEATWLKVAAVGIVIGILLINSGDLFGVSATPKRPAGALEVTAPARSADELAQMEHDLARDLEQTLSAIRGAGQVRVSVSLEAGPMVKPVFNNRTQVTKTGEKAGDGSLRDSTTETRDQTNVVVQDGNSQSLAIEKRTRAQIAGVTIVAEGARDATVKEMLFRAAVTRLGIAGHKVTVMPAQEGGGR
jgi:stage III sporulation protein AG